MVAAFCNRLAFGITVRSNDPHNESSAKGIAVTRVLDILSAVATAGRPLSPTEIGKTLSIPKATTHRLCAILLENGYLQTPLNGRGLQVGNRLNQLAMGVLAAAPLQAQRRAILTTLSRETGETCNIAVPDGAEMIYLDRAETHWHVRIDLQLGSRMPAFATAEGKMYLSSLSDKRLKRIIDGMRLERYTSNTLVSHDALRKDIEDSAGRGYALDNEEYIDGMVALAVPVYNHLGRLYATLSLHAPSTRIPFGKVSSFLSPLQTASRQLSELPENY